MHKKQNFQKENRQKALHRKGANRYKKGSLQHPFLPFQAKKKASPLKKQWINGLAFPDQEAYTKPIMKNGADDPA